MNFFEDPDHDIDDWHMGNLRILPKKGDLHQPNNWRGINLLDSGSKIMSLIITARLQVFLKKEAQSFNSDAHPKQVANTAPSY